MDKAHILVVDDDDRLRALLKKFLREQGFMVSEASDAAQARRRLAWFSFDAMVLDMMMPGETGAQMLASLGDTAPPTLMLSAMGEVEDRILGLEKGAEDYLVKPFEPKELVLRLATILRRSALAKELKKEPTQVTFGDYIFDMETAQLRLGAEPVALTSSESSLLKILAENAGKPVSREELSKQMPGGVSERSVDVQVTRLRKKIGDDGKTLHLQTVRGAGYVLYAGRAPL
ncbi:MAG: DNA-binding response regulator [Alphaproteobacteria bacterium]|nr:DNA-binding response regulator [Alphaproteobacteria bacterium]